MEVRCGFVASIYVHDMWHVAMLQRFGIPATPPMFIPGIGAVIRSRLYPRAPIWVALAHVGAWINEAPTEGDARTLWEFSLLVIILGAMTRLPVPIKQRR